MNKPNELYLHNDALSRFNTKLMNNIFTSENIASRKKMIKAGTNADKLYGFYLEKNHELYFAVDEEEDSLISELPFRVLDYVETDYKGEVFKLITSVETIQIPSVKHMSFRELVDFVPNFSHTHPNHFTLYKIVARAAYAERINARIVTDAGFGKDSVININSQLVNSSANIYGASFAKLEYLLRNHVIVLNEMGNLKSEDKQNMQEFFLATGAYANEYTKRSRKTSQTEEQYDISQLSLIIFYNLPEYYISKGQDYFDTMFTTAVINRFIPFVFNGQITTKFETMLDPEALAEEYDEDYKKIIATINWYRENPVTELKYDVPDSVKFPDFLNRYSRTFYTIMKYVGEYANSQEEFNELVSELYDRYKAYSKLTESSSSTKKTLV